jgi:hypothetical protein
VHYGHDNNNKKIKKHCLSADGYKPKKASAGYVGRIQYWTLGRIIMGMIALCLGNATLHACQGHFVLTDEQFR